MRISNSESGAVRSRTGLVSRKGIKEYPDAGVRKACDIEDSRAALIRDCFVRSGDDCFEVKSRYESCRLPIENITFDN